MNHRFLHATLIGSSILDSVFMLQDLRPAVQGYSPYPTEDIHGCESILWFSPTHALTIRAPARG